MISIDPVPSIALAKPQHGRDAAAREASFAPRDREVVEAYYAEGRSPRGCPPGLAKKHNGCLPPGQAKKRYTVGEALPSVVVVEPLPRSLEIRLGLPPVGYRYAVVDGDVVKLVVGSLLVVDAISGLAQ